MSNIVLSAHFDGEQIRLDEPYQIVPNARLTITVLLDQDAEREDWVRFSQSGLSAAYTEDETEYTLDDVKELNPAYLRR